ncbi:hypothetical protein EJ04DRAFT_126880 [Polyplosphaeria fusca]|uniref:Uncharacterized protein n=1 Tax=Polyplosphaeria fusca TaxID=682080 RepID=A0A9P4R5K2_9PLEO|nr:hypothetical protein EJ04DRAFT_126880 [Polyplosphaeria fusca]
MKSSTVLASLLFGSLAVAAPVDKRALATKYETVVETVVVYTTVWEGEAPSTVAAEATSSAPGLFYEQPSKPSSVAAQPTTSAAPAYTPPPVAPSKPSSSSAYVPPPPPPSSSSVYTPPPQQYTPPPSPAYTPPPAPASSAAPAQSSQAPSNGGGGGDSHHGDITIYDNTGAAGACGKPLTDDMMIVALAHGAFGASTYDYMTGEATNPWCGKTITIEYNGNKIEAEIQDLCPGCDGEYDIDLSLSAWKALTGLDEKTRLQADWWVS